MEVNYEKFRGYNGNANLKRSGVGVEWTAELVAEYMKCAEDPIYFIEKYMKIINLDKGLINFDLYPYQKKMVDSMLDNRYTVIATARQAGKSTVTCGFILWYIIFNSEKTVALLANKGDTAREILGKIQLAYQHLPKWMQQGVEEWNKGSFVLENKSRVIATSTSSDSIRGYTINLLFIDEAAFIENWDAFFTSTLPTISSGKSTKIILVSTPNGLNHFYKIWKYAEEGKNEYNPIKVMWYDVPGRDEEWKKSTLAANNFDEEKFAQENCVEFLGSSGTLISGWKLKELTDLMPVEEKPGVKQYFKPEKDRIYAVIADVSRGKGLDYSAANVIDVTQMPYQQVCIIRDNTLSPIEYAQTLFQLSKAYNGAFVLVETNDIGGQVVDSLHMDYEYDSILYTQNAGRAGKIVSTGFSGNNERGIRTTKLVKSVGCSILKLLIEQNQLIINDFDTIEELSRFSRKGNSFEAENGFHDDLVMTLVLFAWLSDQDYFKEMTNISTLSKLREKTEEDLINEMLPFGFIEDGRSDDFHDALELGSPVMNDRWLWQ